MKSFDDELRSTKKMLFSSAYRKLIEYRSEKVISQTELAKVHYTSYSVFGKYERDNVNTANDPVRGLVDELEPTVTYLIGEAGKNKPFRDQDVLRRLKVIHYLPTKEKEYILYNLDAILRDIKINQIGISISMMAIQTKQIEYNLV